MTKSHPRFSLFITLFLCITVFSHADETPSANAGEEFGAWMLHCQGNDSTNCVMSQLARWEATGETLSRINVFLSTPTRLEVLLPLGTALDNPPKLYIEDNLTGQLNPKECLQDGCYFHYTLDESGLEQILSMEKGHIEAALAEKNSLKIPVSGEGTRAAYKRYQERVSQ